MYAIVNKENGHVVSKTFTTRTKSLVKDVRLLNAFCCYPKYQIKRVGGK